MTQCSIDIMTLCAIDIVPIWPLILWTTVKKWDTKNLTIDIVNTWHIDIVAVTWGPQYQHVDIVALCPNLKLSQNQTIDIMAPLTIDIVAITWGPQYQHVDIVALWPNLKLSQKLTKIWPLI